MSTPLSNLYSGVLPGHDSVPEAQRATFRRGRPDDAEQAAALIYAAGPPEFRYVFCNHAETDALAFLNDAWRRGGQFGYDEHLCIDVGGKVVGIGTARTKSDNQRLLWSSIKAIAGYFSPWSALNVSLRGLLTERAIPPAEKGQLYIANIAVSPQHRGQGLAHSLISQLIQFSPQPQLVPALHVNANNDNAHRLYYRMGFEDIKLMKSNLRSKFGEVNAHWLMEIPHK